MILALHGFLGLPADWAPFDGAFTDKSGHVLTLRKWNLYADLPARAPAPDGFPMRVWAREFCQRVADGWNIRDGAGITKPVLLGYSMGGRLALHALLERPDLFSCAVIIGAHPGLAAEDLKRQRRLNDARWAERFRREDWTSLVRAWGEQDVFKSAAASPDAVDLTRREVDYDRALLARAMQLWSLAGQQDLREELADVRVATLWLSGAADRRFRDLYRELRMDLADSPAHVFAQIPGAGHRAPWENPSAFVHEVQNFLSQVL